MGTSSFTRLASDLRKISIGSGRSLGLFHLPCCDLGSRSRKARPAAALRLGQRPAARRVRAPRPKRRWLSQNVAPCRRSAGPARSLAGPIGWASRCAPLLRVRRGKPVREPYQPRDWPADRFAIGNRSRVRECEDVPYALPQPQSRTGCLDGCRTADADPLRTSRSRSARAPAPEPAPASPDAAAAVPYVCRRQLPPKLAAPPSGMAQRDRPIGSEVHFALG